MIEEDKVYKIAEDKLQELLENATKSGIQIGKELARKKEPTPIDSPLFNTGRLFQSGKYPSARITIWDMLHDRGLIPKTFSEPDPLNFSFSDTLNDIRQIVLNGCNAKLNRDVPRKQRQDAVNFYDHLIDEWITFAEEHLPDYSEKGGQL